MDKTEIAVLDFKTENISITNAKIISHMFREKLSQNNSLNVVSYKEMTQALTNRQLLECNDINCAEEIGNQLKIDKIIIGELSKIDRDFILIIKLIDIKQKKGIAGYKIIKQDENEIKKLLIPLAEKIVKKIFEFKQVTSIPEKIPAKEISKPKEQKKVPLGTFRHSIITALSRNSADFYEYYFTYDDIQYGFLSSSENYSSTIYNISYFLYLTPVYVYENASYFLYSLLSRPGYINGEISYMPNLEGTYNYDDKAPGYEYSSHRNYNSEEINYYLKCKYFIIRWTGLYAEIYKTGNKYESEYSSITLRSDFSRKTDGLGYTFGLTQYLIPRMFLSFYARFYSSKPESHENGKYDTGDWIKIKSSNDYKSQSYIFNVYYVTDELNIKMSTLENIGIGISYSILNDVWEENTSFDASYSPSEKWWEDGKGEEKTFSFWMDQYYRKDILFSMAYSRNSHNEYIINNFDSLFMYKSIISTYFIGIKYYITKQIAFSLSYKYNSFKSKLNSEREESWLWYNSFSVVKDGSISGIDLSLDYRF